MYKFNADKIAIVLWVSISIIGVAHPHTMDQRGCTSLRPYSNYSVQAAEEQARSSLELLCVFVCSQKRQQVEAGQCQNISLLRKIPFMGSKNRLSIQLIK